MGEVVTMYRTIVVPLDGTPLAERALPFAEYLATLAGARLRLVRAVREGADAATAGAARSYLDALTGDFPTVAFPVEATVVTGEASAALAREAERTGADLIVMVTSGHGLLGRGGGRSVSDGLLARVAIPILLVRDWHTAEVMDRRPAGYRSGPRIVVPLDGSPLAALAVEPAREFAAILRGEIVLVRAVPTDRTWVPPGGHPAADDRPARQADDASSYLREVAATLRDSGCAVHWEVASGTAPEVVHECVQRHRAAVLVMATHGETGSPDMPLGSIARQVIWGADAPIVLIHPALPRANEPVGLSNAPPAPDPQPGAQTNEMAR